MDTYHLGEELSELRTVFIAATVGVHVDAVCRGVGQSERAT